MNLLGLFILLISGVHGCKHKRKVQDPLKIEDVDYTFFGDEKFHGHVRAFNMKLFGSSTIKHSINYTKTSIMGIIKIPNAKLTGNLDVAVTNDEDEIRLGTYGPFFLQQKNFYAHFTLDLNVQNPKLKGHFTVIGARLKIHFGEFTCSFDDAYLDDDLNPNWDEISAQLTENAHAYFAEMKKEAANMVKHRVNQLFSECSFNELANGKYDCIQSTKILVSLEIAIEILNSL